MTPHRADVTPRRPYRRLLLAAAGAAVVSLGATACDSSPVAASVNGSQIKQTALYSQLRLQTANKAYVASVDRAAAASPGSISITGDAPGTYSARFVAGVLSTMIQAAAVHQHLASVGRLPGAPQLAAARAVDEALFGATWLSFPQAFRDTQVVEDAEHAQVEPAPTDLQTLRSAYTSVRRYFFAQVCTRTIAVSVTGAGGSLDPAASLIAANRIVGGYASSRPQGGEVACYDGAALEQQGAATFAQILALAPGQAAAPQRTSFGYQVVAVDSRQPLPLDQAGLRALALGIAEAQGSPDPTLTALVAKARVTVGPAYGTWDRAQVSVVPSSPLGANSSTSP